MLTANICKGNTTKNCIFKISLHWFKSVLYDFFPKIQLEIPHCFIDWPLIQRANRSNAIGGAEKGHPFFRRHILAKKVCSQKLTIKGKWGRFVRSFPPKKSESFDKNWRNGGRFSKFRQFKWIQNILLPTSIGNRFTSVNNLQPIRVHLTCHCKTSLDIALDLDFTLDFFLDWKWQLSRFSYFSDIKTYICIQIKFHRHT